MCVCIPVGFVFMHVHWSRACIRAVHASGQFIAERGQKWRSPPPNRCEFVITHLLLCTQPASPSRFFSMVRWLNSMVPYLLYFCTPLLIVFTFPCIALLHHFHSLSRLKFITAMQICHCHIVLRFLFCYCHFLLFLAVLVGTDHSWSHGFQWMPQAVHLTYSNCFSCTEGRFGKGGLVNHLQPTTNRIGLLQRRKENGECRKPEDLDFDRPYAGIPL